MIPGKDNVVMALESEPTMSYRRLSAYTYQIDRLEDNYMYRVN